jgi:hypothetical protein
MKLKKDRYTRMRGGTTKLLEISCSFCQNPIMQYQKDGKGYLHRCYFNRIKSPESLAKLGNCYFNKSSEIMNLTCSNCNCTIGTPIKYSDGRWAFRLNLGKYNTSLNK